MKTWQGRQLGNARRQVDSGAKTGALLGFGPGAGPVQLKIGISFLSTAKARQNVASELI